MVLFVLLGFVVKGFVDWLFVFGLVVGLFCWGGCWWRVLIWMMGFCFICCYVVGLVLVFGLLLRCVVVLCCLLWFCCVLFGLVGIETFVCCFSGYLVGVCGFYVCV